MDAKVDIKKFVFLNEFFDRFNLIKAQPVEVDIFDTDKYINEYVKIVINNNFMEQLGFTDVPQRNFSTIKKMSKETRMAVPNKLRCPELRAFTTDNMIHKLAIDILTKYNDDEKEKIKQLYPSTQSYKPTIVYEFDDFDKVHNRMLTKFGNVVNIIVKKTVAELKRRAPKTVEDAMKEIDIIVNEFKSAENNGDKRRQFDVTKEVFAKLQQNYKNIINYKKEQKDNKNDSIISFTNAVMREVKQVRSDINSIAVQHYVCEALPQLMEEQLTIYANLATKETSANVGIAHMIKTVVESHEKPPKPVKEKKPKQADVNAEPEPEPEVEEQPAPIEEIETVAEPEEIEPAKPKKAIKKKAHKK